MRRIILISLIAVALVPVTLENQAHGVTLERAKPELRFTEKPIAILPIRNLKGVSADTLFSTSASSENNTRLQSEQLLIEETRSVLVKDPRFHAITPDDIQEIFANDPGHSTALSLVNERFLLGLDLYDALRLPEAIHHLEEARRHASNLYLEILEPVLLSRIYLVLGLSYLEENMKGQAHVAFKKMFLLHPQRRVRKGYYSTETEQALTAALIDALASDEHPWPMDAKHLNSLLKRIGAAQAILFVESNERMEWIATDGIRTWRDSESFEGKNTDAVTSRPISRWISCLDGLVAKPRIENFTPEFRLDSNLTHGLFLQQPTRQMSHQVGVTTNGTFRFNRYLDGSVKIGFLSMLQDPLQDLQGDVMGIRGTFATGFSFRRHPFMWFIRSGIDLLYLDSFTVLNNPDCKFFGTQSTRCPTGSTATSNKSILGGLALFIGGALDLSDEIYMNLHSGISLYKNLTGTGTEFNYLLTNELGLGYRF